MVIIQLTPGRIWLTFHTTHTSGLILVSETGGLVRLVDTQPCKILRNRGIFVSVKGPREREMSWVQKMSRGQISSLVTMST